METQILEEDYSETLTSVENLALTYTELGRLDEAPQMQEVVWES